MQKEFQNLLNREEWIVLNLKNTTHQVKLYLDELPRFRKQYTLGHYEEKAEWFQQVFEYYKKELIPAIQETAEMEIKHLAIYDKSPDPGFRPVLEVENHQRLTKDFLARFEEIHKEFDAYILEVKKSCEKVG